MTYIFIPLNYKLYVQKNCMRLETVVFVVVVIVLFCVTMNIAMANSIRYDEKQNFCKLYYLYGTNWLHTFDGYSAKKLRKRENRGAYGAEEIKRNNINTTHTPNKNR